MTGNPQTTRRKRGRPRKDGYSGARFAFRVSDYLWDEIMEICQREGITKTDFILRALEHEVKCNQRDYAVVEGFGDVEETEMNWSKIKQATREMLKAVERKGYH